MVAKDVWNVRDDEDIKKKEDTLNPPRRSLTDTAFKSPHFDMFQDKLKAQLERGSNNLQRQAADHVVRSVLE